MGIHTSILMSESAEGLRVTATLQNAGSCLKAAFCCAPFWTVGDNENSPAATFRASVIVASCKDNDFKLSHVAL
jgi:hypothetical protein